VNRLPGHSAPQRGWGTFHSHAALHPQFAGPENVARLLIRAAKTSSSSSRIFEYYVFKREAQQPAGSLIILKLMVRGKIKKEEYSPQRRTKGQVS
jgi:hypothetical protein